MQESIKTILCYGDSNTFGYIPKSGLRYDSNTRWTGLLQQFLGTDFKVIEEGCCDRTGFKDNPKGELFSAQKHFPTVLSKYNKIDIIILALGTNDLQFQYNITDLEIENGLNKLIVYAKSKSNNVILIPPIRLKENLLNGFFKIQFDEKSIEKSKYVGDIYKKSAKEYNCIIFDINEFTAPSNDDGLHYDTESHKIIAEKLKELFR